MVTVTAGTTMYTFKEMLELKDYKRICEENEKMRKQISVLKAELSVISADAEIKDEKFLEQKKIISEKDKIISELEAELSVKEDLLKIKNAYNDKDWSNDLEAMENFEIRIDEETLKQFSELKKEGKGVGEPLPFSDEQYEEDLIEELEDRHQQDCITINQLHTTIDILVDRYAKLRKMRGL